MLRTLITIERLTSTADGMGGFTEVWTADPTAGVYAFVKFMSGTERWEADRVHPGNLVRAIIRFRGDANGAPYYTSGDRVMIRGREYGITAVSDIEFVQKWIQIEMFEGQPS